MQKRRLGSTRLSDGYDTANRPPEAPAPAAPTVRDLLAAEIIADPAHVLIRDWLLNADTLGFDPGDPDIIRRAMKAGREQYARYEARGEFVATFKAMRASRRENRRHIPVVYYMRMSDLVKIGTSTNVGSRISDLGAQGIMAVEPGGSRLEHERHDQFAHLHDHREWFRLAPDLAEHISERREVFDREMGRTTEEWLRDWLPRPKAKGRTLRDVVAI